MQELLEELAAIETVKAEIEAKLIEATQSAKVDLVKDLSTQILASGFEVAEIAAMLTRGTAKRAAKEKPAKAAAAAWALKSDPTKIYTRGPLPGWMKDAMGSDGFASTKEGRQAFKDAHMVRA